MNDMRRGKSMRLTRKKRKEEDRQRTKERKRKRSKEREIGEAIKERRKYGNK